MKPNTMRSVVPLPSRQKAFVSATASRLTHFRGRLGLLLNQRGSMASFQMNILYVRNEPTRWLCGHKAWPITELSGWRSPKRISEKKWTDIFPLSALKVQFDYISETSRKTTYGRKLIGESSSSRLKLYTLLYISGYIQSRLFNFYYFFFYLSV